MKFRVRVIATVEYEPTLGYYGTSVPQEMLDIDLINYGQFPEVIYGEDNVTYKVTGEILDDTE